MNYILDTNICIHILKTKSFEILKHAKKNATSSIAISVITEAELWYGVWNSKKVSENKKHVELFIDLFPKIQFTSSSARISGSLKYEQKKKGKSIGFNDLLIASQALDLDAVLVTNNEKEFKQIKDLRIENWLK